MSSSSTVTGALTDHGDLDLVRLLSLVERTVVARLAEVLKASGTTIEEWRVLSLLGEQSGRTMTEIAEFALLPAPTLTKLVDRMVSANLVLRRPDDIDRRRVLVFASERGRDAVRHWRGLVERESEELAELIGGEELALLRALLVRISGRLT